MTIRAIRNLVLLSSLVFLLVCAGVAPSSLYARNQTTAIQDKSRSRRVNEQATPTPTPQKEDVPRDSDEVVRVETNLTSIFFTAADSNKRFISNMKKEDIQVLEDGQLHEIFNFQTHIDMPLS